MAQDLVEQSFGWLKVLERRQPRYYAGGTRIREYRWLCRCRCGKLVEVTTSNLKYKKDAVISCGCYRKQMCGDKFRKHGESNQNITPEYRAWTEMNRRCYCETNEEYASYGGRGIAVVEAWRNSYEQFLADMGRRPSPKHSLDREDNDGDYGPENCKWATRLEQSRNCQNTIWLTLNGRTQSLTAWADERGLHAFTLRMRKQLGWTDEKTLTTPVRDYVRRTAITE